ncbi:MAG: hypothetical protein IT435_05510 [Phycisphaerales bacterium]|nr:hypothetical protein [Phycisphaerales bacterium]
MTIAQLKAAIEHLPDNARVLVAANYEEHKACDRYGRELTAAYRAKAAGDLESTDDYVPLESIYPVGTGVELEEVVVISASHFGRAIDG